jgi:cysteine synthase
MLREAEAQGLLAKGGSIVEGTGGNTGIALAQLGAARGYKVVICMPQSIASEKVDLIRRLGAEIHLQPLVPYLDPRNYAKKAELIAIERGCFNTNQFENLANFRAHFNGTGPEIWQQTNKNIDIFITAAGTGDSVHLFNPI